MKLKMARLQIVGLKTHLVPTVGTLHRLGCVQIDDVSETSDISARPLRLDRDMVRMQEELGYLVARIEGLLSTLGVARVEPALSLVDRGLGETSATNCAAKARAGLDALGPQVQALVTRREALEAEQASLPRYEATLRKLLPIVPPAARDAANTSIGVLVSRAHLAVLDTIAERVLDLTAAVPRLWRKTWMRRRVRCSS